MAKSRGRVGLWMIGAGGGIGSTVALGLAALRKGLVRPVGLVSELEAFSKLGLVHPADIVLGGHEVRKETLYQATQASQRQSGLFTTDLIERCRVDLRTDQRRIRPGTLYGACPSVLQMSDRSDVPKECSPLAAIERLADDIRSFQKRHRLRAVVVVHVASAEPACRRVAAHRGYVQLEKQLTKKDCKLLPASSIYALAALEAGCPYINFTPSTGINLPAVAQRAQMLDLPFMGNDGKTGESLVKSFLAPMFALRNLSVRSWFGQNILGNRDGLVLRDPKTKRTKIRSKDGLLASLQGDAASRTVAIDYVASLGDWKVAWDFIHFEGFLNTTMSLQFTWQGSDSVLAAPLVIDLARFAEHAHRRGLVGPLTHLACFFKSPIGVAQQAYPQQWEQLMAYVRSSLAT
ncbi:MAG: inositol-3-phosphate synthase [Phycisphaerae bacterium]